MAFFFTEQQVVEAARKAYREHAEADQKALAEWRSKGPVKLSDWTDPDTELDQIPRRVGDRPRKAWRRELAGPPVGIRRGLVLLQICRRQPRATPHPVGCLRSRRPPWR